MYGFDGIYQLGLDAKMTDKFPIKEIIDKIVAVFCKVKPNIIYLPFCKDVHSDHKLVFEAAYSCAKIFRYSFIKKVMMMETISETEFAPSLQESAFMPNLFVDITDFFRKKLEIIQIFKHEIRAHPFPRSLKNIEALAIFRGAMARCKYAEGFMVLKEIQ